MFYPLIAGEQKKLWILKKKYIPDQNSNIAL